MLISIIIPFYNVQEYIEECLESVINQTYPEVEIICIDNKSTDKTLAKLVDFKKKYPSLIIETESKSGAPAARNKGLSLAKGEWIQFLDADDLLLNGKLEHQTNLVHHTSNIAFIAGAYIKRSVTGINQLDLPDSENAFKSVFFSRLGITSSNLWNSKYISQVGGWDESLKSSQEADLMFRILQINPNIICDMKPLTVVRERSSGQISQSNLDQKWKRYFLKRIEMMEWMKSYKKEYFLSQEQVFKDGLFGVLKILASEDAKLAVELYEEYLGPNFKPAPSQKHSRLQYLLLLRLFGFKKTERIRKFFA